MLEALLTWKVALGVGGAILAAIQARNVNKAAKEVIDVIQAIEAAQVDGKITTEEARVIVIQAIEAAAALAPYSSRLFGFVKRTREAL